MNDPFLGGMVCFFAGYYFRVAFVAILEKMKKYDD